MMRIAWVSCCAMLVAGGASAQRFPDHPTIAMNGITYTPQSLAARDLGAPGDQTAPFPAHKVIGNVYYVGTRSLSSFLIVTTDGSILINSSYEQNVPNIRASVEQLGFRFSEIKIVLGSNAHDQHQEGNALVKSLTGARVIAMAEDVPALRGLRPGGKEHPVDRIVHDGSTVTLGGTTLTAHLTAGHTAGCTTWTMAAEEGGRTYNVRIGCSLRVPPFITPRVVAEFTHTFQVMRQLACDVPLSDYPAAYEMEAKVARRESGGPNPFVDAAGCRSEVDLEEAMFHASTDGAQLHHATR